ncbi:MAG TPA: cytochrome c oxidase subunit 3 family protein [Terriglobales bacterium]|nr:cytochrome c oxidase subunit 3 family protein [Terriglobales bacterium]
MSDSTAAVEHAEHNDPALLHHFATAQQQRDTASLGMWLFLATEVMFFGGMFCAYLVYRYWYYNEFAAGSRSISIWLGTINTVVLICSSLTVALGVKAAQLGKRKQLVSLLLATLVFGVAFLGIKGVEWYQKYEEHHVPGRSFDVSDIIRDYPQIHIDPSHSQLYFSLYFAMTGLHALHMIVGIGIFSFLTYYSWKGKYGPEYYTPIENGGLYWHFVDIVWIYLFPLLYLIDRKPLR